jgi:hemolysin III
LFTELTKAFAMNHLKSSPTTTLDYSFAEELINAISHGIGLILSCIALFLFINTANDDQARTLSLIIFALTSILLFLASTIYHSAGNYTLKKTFKLLDHCAIYLLIAGTYTPILAISIAGPLGYSLLVLIWGLAISGIIFKIKFGHKYKKISLASYLGMGFIALAILGELYQALPIEALYLLFLGGIIYATGVIFYVKKNKPFTHAIWHCFVLAGAICHFLMIYWYV